MKDVDAYIFAPRDPDAGLVPISWTISGGFIFENNDDREFVREQLGDAFESIADDGAVQVVFSDERTGG